MRTNNRNFWKLLAFFGIIGSSVLAFGQDATAPAATPAATPITSELLFWLLLVVAAILLFVIYALSEMIIWGVKRKIENRNSSGAIFTLAILFIGLLTGTPAHAQDAATKAVAQQPSFWSDPYMPFYLLITIEVLIIAWLSFVLFNMLQPEKEAEPEVVRESVITKVWNKINPTLPVEREDEIKLEDHEYDGIVELGNKMPPWLQFIFYVTILFAVIYAPYYLLGYGKTMDEKYQDELAIAELERAERMKNSLNNVDENNVQLVQTGDVLNAGKETFVQFCVACHGNGGEGGVGPNLTDDYWIHGGSINDIFKTIKYGVPEKGMISWQDLVTPKQMGEVANYIKSLYGTNPPNAKEPQGVLWVEGGDAPAATDTTAAPAVVADTAAVAQN
jgi:cytochrome c oxidase cbb3-type subunit 3